MTVQKALKIFAAILLVTSAMLPTATRSYYADSAGTPIALHDTGNLPVGAYQVVVAREYLIDAFDLLDGYTWIVVLVITWPIITLSILWRKPRGKVAITVRVFEVLLLLYTSNWVWLSTWLPDAFLAGYGGPPMTAAVGAYFAYAAVSMYGAAAIWDDVSLTRSWWMVRRTKKLGSEATYLD